ncbi:hypothetical protein [Ferrimonas senticii]|uniref:hypothetical protein n=1 Tax=Ferrimonas senticii TaxID=394566 RepID=UPI000414D474|nr:hypothetical protein [Ferrimonas senticii]
MMVLLGRRRGYRPLLPLALLLLLLMVFYSTTPTIDLHAPANGLLQQRLLMSVNGVRSEWLLQGQPLQVRWRNPEQITMLLPTTNGWPQPQQGCRLLWQQLMGAPALALLSHSQWQQDHCHFQLQVERQLRYFPATGSVVSQ